MFLCRRSFSACFLFIVIAACGGVVDLRAEAGDEPLGGRVFSIDAGHSIRIPHQWLVKTNREGQLTFLKPTPETKERALIILGLYNPNGQKLGDFLKTFETAMNSHGLELIATKEVKTDSGLVGTKLTLRDKKAERVQITYFFEDILRQRLEIDCMCSSERAEVNEKLFDKAVSSVCAMQKSPPIPTELGEKYTDLNENFSLNVPRGWDHREGAAVTFGPQTTMKGAELTFKTDVARISLAQYAEATRKGAGEISLLPVKEDPFTTTSGIKGVRLEWTTKLEDSGTVSTFYFLFSGKGDRKISVVWVFKSGEEGQYEKIVSDCMKTLQVEAK